MKKNRVVWNFSSRKVLSWSLKKKVALLLLVMITALSSTQNCYSQKTSFNLKLDNVSVKQAFQEIEKKSDYIFIYSDQVVDLNRKVIVNVQNGDVGAVLQQVFKGTNNTYKINKRQITILVKSKEQIESEKKTANDQTKKITITGTITDDTGESLPGVSVVIKGTTSGTITDIKGNYSISNVPADGALLFSFIGMADQEIVVGKESTVNVTMLADVFGVDEVVVVGYQTIQKSDLTGSLGSVKAGDLTKIASSSFESSLAGRASGVQVTSSEGAPGAGMNITIRGANSISASSAPLYVVDGFPITVKESELGGSGVSSNAVNPLSAINQEDIESIEILKDASATAIYGSRGANGVVLITTKKGKKGELKLSYSGYAGIQNLQNSRKIELLNAQQYLDYVEEIEPGSYLFWEDEDQTIPRDNSNAETIDWQDEMYRTALIQNHHITLGGGKGGSFFNASIGYFNQEGILKGSDYDRFTSKVAFTHQFNKKLKIQNVMSFASSENNGLVAANKQGIYSGIVTATLKFRPYLPDFEDIPFDPTINTTSPKSMAERITKNLRYHNFSNMLQLNYDISPSLKFTARLMLNLQNISSEEFYPPDVAQGTITNGRAFNSNRETTRWVNENLLNYVKKRGDHKINAVAGFTIEKYNLSEVLTSVTDFPIYDLGSGKLNAGLNPGIPDSNILQTSLVSFLGRANYVFKDRYYLTAGIRADGSSKFTEGNKFGYFPSLALAYRLSEEDFIKNLNFFDNLKIRTSYGKTGNQSIPAYSSLGILRDANYSYNGNLVYAVSPSKMQNNDLTWETTDQFDVGLDFMILNRRLTLTTDAYYKKTYDLLLNSPVPYHSGYSTYFNNIGELENKGVEFSIEGTIVSKPDFQWKASYNMTFNRNKIIKLADSDFIDIDVPSDTRTLNEYRIMEGESIGSMWGLVWDGVYQYDDFTNFDELSSVQDKADLYQEILDANGTFNLRDGVDYLVGNQTTTRPGEIKYRKTNDDGTNEITEDDKTIIGDATPDFFGGFTNDFKWKNWDLSALISFSYGGDVYNANRYSLEAMDAIYANFSTSILDRWTPDKPSEKMHSSSGFTKYVSSSYAVEDGSYIRLSNLTLGYNLPKKVVKKLGIDNCRFTLSGDNIYVLTNYSGYDPEVSVSRIGLAPGYDSGAYPRPSVYKLGLKVTF
ncbi:TonB-dependent receptor [Marinilabilia rubra]|uniref:Secretin/TonB short N-terminal domain-containing protein n=1 Tax=Marinilabilia rubra TaxID=2162893 RepID=A0A2U2B8D5_9BACT|nr:TonB-dependent receptor [Marinilabilia rubra]PWD99351.1 hypothetical protein DDZ16_10085 [Marinilabilia rubra]